MNPLHDFKSEIKLFLIVAAVSAVVAVAGIVLLQVVLRPSSHTPQSQTPDAEDFTLSPSTPLGINSVEGWQTYRNEEFGFEVKYPHGINIDTNIDNWDSPQNVARFWGNIEIESVNYRPNLSLYVGDGEEGRVGELKKGYGEYHVEHSERVINGRKWEVGTIYPREGGNLFTAVKVFYTEKDGVTYLWECYGCVEGPRYFEENRVLFEKIIPTFRFVGETACSSTEVQGYNYQFSEDALHYAAGFDGEAYVDLDEDGREEIARAYLGDEGWVGGPPGTADAGFAEPPGKMALLKVVSDTEGCSNEVFSYELGGNLVGSMDMYPNFWGGQEDVLVLNSISYGGGSGSSGNLLMLAYRNGQYELITGPPSGGYGEQYKFAGENGIGSKVIVAENRWQTNPPDYCAGCPSRKQFFIYTWSGSSYERSEAGITQDKYITSNIDEILQTEPQVLNDE